MATTALQRIPISKGRLWTGHVMAGWLVVFLLFDAGVKVLKLSIAVDGTTRLGYPEQVIVALGVVELICLIAYAIPRTSIVGAILLTGYLGGATATQVRVADPWFLFPVVLGGLLWAALWLRDSRLGSVLFETA